MIRRNTPWSGRPFVYLWPLIGALLIGPQRTSMKRLAILLSIIYILPGCSTDVDINAPYENITIVYGLLNMRDSVHFVKINKAYLGEGDAFDFALVPDSNEWGPGAIAEAKVYRISNNAIVDSFPLYDTLITNRVPGTFYSPDQTLYYFRTPDQVLVNGSPQIPSGPTYLHQDNDYRLKLVVKGEEIGASTTIVNDFSFSGPDQSPSQTIALKTNNGFGAYELNWTSNLDGKRYEAQYRFNYREVRGTDTTGILNVTQRIGTDVRTGSSNFEPMAVLMEGELFYNTLAALIPNDPSVDHRIFLGIDFLVSVANDEFHTFLSLDEPISGVVEDRPSYTNITNGYGIFASRYTKNIIGKRLNSTSLEELVDGNITGQLRFCSGVLEDQNGSFACP